MNAEVMIPKLERVSNDGGHWSRDAGFEGERRIREEKRRERERKD